MKEVLKKFILYIIIMVVIIITTYIVDYKLLENGVNITSVLFLVVGTELEAIKNIILKSKTVFVEKEEKEEE